MTLRLVEEGDAQVLFDWRMDPATRRNAKNTGEFDFESHLQWFNASLADPERTIFIAQDEVGNKLGQVRFDRDGGMALIGIVVSPEMRGKGIGTELLQTGCQLYLKQSNVDFLLAEIKTDNLASITIFENAGFLVQERTDGLVRMTLHR